MGPISAMAEVGGLGHSTIACDLSFEAVPSRRRRRPFFDRRLLERGRGSTIEETWPSELFGSGCSWDSVPLITSTREVDGWGSSWESFSGISSPSSREMGVSPASEVDDLSGELALKTKKNGPILVVSSFGELCCRGDIGGTDPSKPGPRGDVVWALAGEVTYADG